MRTLLRACAVAALLAGFTASAEAQLRGVAGAGLSFPVGDFADETGGAAKGGGGTVFLGAEWMPPGRLFGLRLEGDFNRFCTTFCDDTGGNLDIKWRLMNVNLNGMLEMPLGEGARLRPYALGGVGVYNYELRGNDVLDAGSQTKVGLNGGLGLNYNAGRVGIFAESRFHNVFATGKDIQYVPVTVGVRIGQK
jgi:Outer membrane protein beta-barrel domain